VINYHVRNSTLSHTQGVTQKIHTSVYMEITCAWHSCIAASRPWRT